MAAMARQNRIWRCNTINFESKFNFYKSLVTSILLHNCETWTLLADSGRGKKDPGFQNQMPEETFRYFLLGAQDQRLMCAEQISLLVGPHEPLLATVKRQKLAWFGHVTRHDSFSKTVLQAPLRVCDIRWLGRGNAGWIFKEWTYLPIPDVLTRASCRKALKRISAKSYLKSPRRPQRSRVKGLN